MSKTDILIPSPTRMQYHTNHTTGAHINHPPHLAILHPPAHPCASCPQVPPPTFPSTFIDFCTCAHMSILGQHHHRLYNHLSHLPGIPVLVPGVAKCTAGMAGWALPCCPLVAAACISPAAFSSKCMR